jgi:hypothetical protein
LLAGVTRRSCRTAVLGVAALALSASLAHAEHASVTLAFSRAKTATTCPDEATFRGLVAARLGYDPFVAAGNRALAVDFERRGNEVVGRLLFAGDSAEKRVERTLRSGAADCFELATSLALVTAVALDPDSLHSPTPEPQPEPVPASSSPLPPSTPTPAPAPASTPAHPPTPAPVPSAPSSVSVRLALAALLPVGIVPAPRGGARAGAHLDLGAWSLGAEGAFLFPSSRTNRAGAGEVTAHVLSGSLVPCAHPVNTEAWVLDLCAVGSFGALRSTAEHVTRAEPATDLFATVGPRVGTVLMLTRGVGLGVSADVPVVLSRVHLHIDDRGQRQEVWSTAPIGFIGAVSLVGRLK